MAKTNPVRIEELLENEGWLRALARSLVGTTDEVDEILQDLWRSAIASPPRHGSHPRAWLRTSLRNVVAARGRRRRWAGGLDQPDTSVVAPGREPGAAAESREIEAHVSRLVLELPEPFRGTVLACYFEGRTPTELAVERGIPAATVRSWLHRGLAILRERLEQRYGRGAASLRAGLLPLLTLAPADVARRLPMFAAAAAGLTVFAAVTYMTLGLGSDPELEAFESGTLEDVAPARVERRRSTRQAPPPAAVVEIEGHRLRFRVDVLQGASSLETRLDGGVALALKGHDGGALFSETLWSSEAAEVTACEFAAGEDVVVDVAEAGGYILVARPEGVRNHAELRLRSDRSARMITEVFEDVVVSVTGPRAHLAEVGLVPDPMHPGEVLPARRVDGSRWLIEGPVAVPLVAALRVGDDEWRMVARSRDSEVRLPTATRADVSVVDEVGSPIPGWRGRLIRDDGLSTSFVAGHEGTHAVPADPGVPGPRLVITAPGHVRGVISNLSEALAAGRPIRLPRENLLGAFASEAFGEQGECTAYLGVGSSPLLRAHVHADGRLVVTDLLYSSAEAYGAAERLFGADREWRLWCCARDGAGRLSRDDAVPAHSLRNGRVSLTRAACRIEMAVTAAETGAAIEGAEVLLVPAPGGEAVTGLAGLIEPVYTDSRGTASWTHAAAGGWFARARADGHDAADIAVMVVPEVEITRVEAHLAASVRCCDEVFTFEDR